MGSVGKEMNYCKLNILLDILKEAGLVSLSPERQISLLNVGEKVDLTQTKTYRRLSSHVR